MTFDTSSYTYSGQAGVTGATGTGIGGTGSYGGNNGTYGSPTQSALQTPWTGAAADVGYDAAMFLCFSIAIVTAMVLI